MPVISTLLWKKQSPTINYTRVDAWTIGENSKFVGLPAWINLHGACILICVPVPGCCFRDLLFDNENIFILCIYPWFCGSCPLFMPGDIGHKKGHFTSDLG